MVAVAVIVAAACQKLWRSPRGPRCRRSYRLWRHGQRRIFGPDRADGLARQRRAENGWVEAPAGKVELEFWAAVGEELMADVPDFDWGPDGPPIVVKGAGAKL